MKLNAIYVTDVPPVKQFVAEELSDVIVIAGPNGVGKTRLVTALLDFFRGQWVAASPVKHPNSAQIDRVRVLVEATCPAERAAWGKSNLDTQTESDRMLLIQTLQKSCRRAHWQSVVLSFESNRAMSPIAPPQFTWDCADPWLETIGWDFPFQALTSRFHDTVHALFRKARARREEIATRVQELMNRHQLTGEEGPPDLWQSLNAEFPDPIAEFRDAFARLLAPKQLLDPEPQKGHLFYSVDGQEFPITSLSSGEREVVSVVFDFLLRKPNDSIVIFDEPELHLHPELSARLLNTLSAIGSNNQFLFCTHSADIIASSLEHTVILLAPPVAGVNNQAIKVREDDETNQTLKLLGQSVGVIALGRKVVLIEGSDSSLDKRTYGSILKNRFPNLVLVPAGGRSALTSFASLQKWVLRKTIWGVDFSMLCDADAAPTRSGTTLDTDGGRLAFLGRYHLENYFLDEDVLAEAFTDMATEDSWLRSAGDIRERLRELARHLLAYAAALDTAAYVRRLAGNVSILPKGCDGKSVEELVEMMVRKAEGERARMEGALSISDIEAYARASAAALQQSLDQDTDAWKALIPGKAVIAAFAKQAGIEIGMLKNLFINRAEKLSPNPFAEIIEIFRRFSEVG